MPSERPRATVTIPGGCRDHVVPMSDPRAHPLFSVGVRQAALSWLVAGFEWPGPDPLTHLVLATVEGEGRLVLGDEEHRLVPGTVAICPARVSRIHQTDQAWQVVTIRLADVDGWARFKHTGPFVLEDEDPHRFAAPILGLLAELPHAATTVLGPSSGRVPMDAFVHRFGAQLYSGQASTETGVLGDPFSLYATILRVQLEALLAGPRSIGLDEGRLRSLWEAVRRQPARDWSIAAQAAYVGVSRATLHRLIARHHESTPGAIVDRIRMNHAVALLAHGELPVKAVAAQVGYSTPYSFSAAFRRINGCPPSAYRSRVAQR